MNRHHLWHGARRACGAAAVTAVLVSCASTPVAPTTRSAARAQAGISTMPMTSLTPTGLHPLGPGRQASDVYAHTRVGMFSPEVTGDRALVYVPHRSSSTVSVIDQASMKVIYTLRVGRQPQHVVPSWDLQTLWVNNNASGSLTPIDPRTGRIAGPAVRVPDPYNLYFTLDGRSAPASSPVS